VSGYERLLAIVSDYERISLIAGYSPKWPYLNCHGKINVTLANWAVCAQIVEKILYLYQ
jgi:hypothetical protein